MNMLLSGGGFSYDDSLFYALLVGILVLPVLIAEGWKKLVEMLDVCRFFSGA